ncbi:class I SAM-dependent rRNA methyltransferase [Halalkalibacter sp. APA_J-10(15)]|uniref:class I SAM-dependent rRNA methyltransferase n=1 Tax=Halalkalibacter sp. APA_J-10(15) TaxID=2933805 RepID=UPI001FF49FB6|nr:class I SAM-dependent rRNA methyltransferase [Halalkalibacter sp. APA_J-10(15)]MCK0469914.1 class I SAM-dependent rRNA methyltransferase [Halalkalibacter sp. APA_J-10(15)]
MNKEYSCLVASSFIKKYKAGYPLITDEAIHANLLKEEGVVFRLVDDLNDFIARAYYGKQNKGIGWVLTYDEQEVIDEAYFIRKFQAAFQQRNSLFRDPETTSFRLFHAEGDGIGGLTIDYFAGFLLINWYSQGIYSFKKPILKALEKTMEYRGIYQKKRFDQGGKYVEEDDYVVGERGSFPLIVKESGIQFAVYLNEGAMVGVFLDQRDVRRTLRDHYANGKTVLNTFSYTGAFSVAAALGGATKTTSVDLANRSLRKTIEQFSVNGLDYEAHDIIVEDVFHYFKYAVKKQLTFDVVILDPPSFARSKKHTFKAGKDYPDLLKQAIAITADNGLIIASTNCAQFQMKRFKVFIDQAFKEMGAAYQIVEEFSLPQDFKTTKSFKEGNYLKVVFIRKQTLK